MDTTILGQVGPQFGADGATPAARMGRSAELVVQELHGRFYEQAFRNNLYSVACQPVTALASTTVLLTASAQPIVGVWNPLSSPVNLSILQIMVQDMINTVTTPALPGAFVIAASTGNGLLTAGLAPFNRKTLASTGSQAKAFTLSTASLLTGLTNNLVVQEVLDVPIAHVLASTIAAINSPIPGTVGVTNLDGDLIVPPGGVLAVLNTSSTTAHSVLARILWEEVLI